MRLYKRAAREEKRRRLLYTGRGLAFWAGSAGHLAYHCGGAPVLLVGLYGKFRLRLQDGETQLCQAAIIPPGLWHELDFGGEPFGALYIEPNLGGMNVLAPLLHAAAESGGALAGICPEIPMLRTFYEELPGKGWAGEGLAELVAFSRQKASSPDLDPRIAAAIDLMDGAGDMLTLDHLARQAGLSPSRFQHLFTRQAGVPFRRYRAWRRLRTAWQDIAKGATITAAAHAAGFFDSAHFSREYRKTFGKAYSDGKGLNPGVTRVI